MGCVLEVLFLTLVLGLVKSYSQSSYYFENHKYCDDLSPYFSEREINLDQIKGVWYGVEKIPHNKGEYRIERTQECFYIDIKEQYIQPTPPSPYGFGDRDSYYNNYNYNYNSPSYNYNSPSYMYTTSPYGNQAYGLQEPYRIRHFVLEWHEGLWQDDYHIKVNTSRKGFWPTDVPNKSVDKMYRFFGGVIQVLEFGRDHLVLNFCMRLPHSQLFSVVLARTENQLSNEDLARIHNVFSMKHLSTSSLKRVCDPNGAPPISLPSAIIFVVTYVLYKCL